MEVKVVAFEVDKECIEMYEHGQFLCHTDLQQDIVIAALEFIHFCTATNTLNTVFSIWEGPCKNFGWLYCDYRCIVAVVVLTLDNIFHILTLFPSCRSDGNHLLMMVMLRIFSPNHKVAKLDAGLL